MTALARIEALSVGYDGEPALDGVTLDIVAGERLAVIGESGSGKSTLGRALAGLLPENARQRGTIAWPALDHAPRPGRDIGFVFQDPGTSLNPVLRIGEQIAEVARRHRGLDWRAAWAVALELAERVQLPQPEAALRAFPHQLSGGQRQRVAIAAAIAGQPKLLIADEPTSALDTIVQAQIVALLDELVRDAAMTLVFITHDMALAAGFADRVAVLRQGRLVEIGPTGLTLTRPQAVYTAELLASHIDLATPPMIDEARA